MSFGYSCYLAPWCDARIEAETQGEADQQAFAHGWVVGHLNGQGYYACPLHREGLWDTAPLVGSLRRSDVIDFDAIHEAGAKRFPHAWLPANRAALAAAREGDLNLSMPVGKAILSLVVLRVLEVALSGTEEDTHEGAG